MERKIKKYLHDILSAINSIEVFIGDNKRFKEYEENQILMGPDGKVQVDTVHDWLSPYQYECTVLATGKQYSFKEGELMTVWQHDKEMGLIP